MSGPMAKTVKNRLLEVFERAPPRSEISSTVDGNAPLPGGSTRYLVARPKAAYLLLCKATYDN